LIFDLAGIWFRRRGSTRSRTSPRRFCGIPGDGRRLERPHARRSARARASLARRFDDCWDRLDDVVSELVALHGMTGDEIVRRVERMIAAELAETG